jgi:hypothetical protein
VNIVDVLSCHRVEQAGMLGPFKQAGYRILGGFTSGEQVCKTRPASIHAREIFGHEE